MEKPKMSKEVKKLIESLTREVESHGHSLEEWKWDEYGLWRTRCQKRNCLAHGWVTPEGACGGALAGECRIKKYSRSSTA